MRVIGYLDLPAASSATHPPQPGEVTEKEESVLRQWCQQQGHQLLRLERDQVEGRHSGSVAGEMTRRPGLCRALAEVECGLADALVLPETTRTVIGPQAAVIIGHQLARHHRALLVVPADAAGEIDPDYEETLEFDEWLRTDLQERLELLLKALADYRQALRPARRAAGQYAGGAPGYGQRVEGGRVVDDPSEQTAIDRAGQLHRAGRSLRQIAAVLAAEGYRPKRGDRWHPTTVARLLQRRDSG